MPICMSPLSAARLSILRRKAIIVYTIVVHLLQHIACMHLPRHASPPVVFTADCPGGQAVGR